MILDRTLPARLYRLARLAAAQFGLWQGLAFALHRVNLTSRSRRPLYTLGTLHADHPVWVRGRTSDIRVFQQVFVERQYACLDDLSSVEVILDLGANVGYSSTYFLSRWPGATLIAVEPDEQNVAVLKQNLAPYGVRAEVIHAGIWSHRCRLRLSEAKYRDGGAWTRQVRECGPGEEGFQAIEVADVIRRPRISVLKMDIEGAEAVVFSRDSGWLDCVENLVIELHDDTSFGNASGPFQRAIEGRGFSVSRFQELTVCKRMSKEPSK